MIGDILSFGKTLLDKIFPNKTEAIAAKNKLDQMAKTGELTEIADSYKLSIAEAKHKNIFVSGWRPLTGWTCSLALFNDVIVRPYLLLFNVHVPALTTTEIKSLLFALLGLGVYRTFEKAKGITK